MFDVLVLLVSTRQKVARYMKIYLASLIEWQGLYLVHDDERWHFGKFCCKMAAYELYPQEPMNINLLYSRIHVM